MLQKRSNRSGARVRSQAMKLIFLAITLFSVGACERRPAPSAAVSGSDGGAALPPSKTAFYANTFERQPSVAEMRAVGRALFFAPELSASGKLACATCHAPDFAFGPPNDLATQLGGVDGKLVGTRAAPSLRYLETVPRFNEHYEDDDAEGVDQGPAGGFTWDGRAPTTHDQARLPLFSSLEMANDSADPLIARLRASRHAAQLRATFGAHVLDSTAAGLKALLMALEVFQQSAPDFFPYDSKYDAYLRKQVKLTPAEARGLALFEDPKKGNCANCHPSRMKRNGAFPAFTDFGLVALGVPRNRALRANSDPDYFDLGLCGPLRTDLSQHKEYCGRFRAPSLRNVTLRKRFFHNGVMTNLKDVMRFYVTRDRDPARWYGKGKIYDDLPAQYRDNVNMEPPFAQSKSGPPILSEKEMDDIIAFLGTLRDGYGSGAAHAPLQP
jgi:cytochrome c peroxidase